MAFVLVILTACGGGTENTTTPAAENQPAANEPSPEAPKVDFPTKEITWIVPVSPGGAYDQISRITAEFMRKYLPNDQPIVIKNMPGSEWALGLGEFYKADPDGHTLSVFNLPSNVINQLKGNPAYDLNKVEWIGRLTTYPLVGVVKPDSNYKSFTDMVSATNFKAGTVGLTSGTGLSTVATLEELKIQGAIIPHKGSSEAITSLLRGDIDYYASSISSAWDLIKNKEVVPVVVFADERVDLLPDVPTAKELGFERLNDFSNPHTTIGLPPETPQEIIDIWVEAFNKTIEDPEYQKRIKEDLKSPFFPAQAAAEIETVTKGFEDMKYILELAKKYE